MRENQVFRPGPNITVNQEERKRECKSRLISNDWVLGNQLIKRVVLWRDGSCLVAY